MSDVTSHRISILRAGAAGGLGLAVLMLLCWIGAFIPFSSPTHAYINLFTPAELHSVRALMEGSFWALLFGLVAGVVFAAAYNLMARLER
jgi:hypothetical protein